MQLHIVSLFPDIFASFFVTSLLGKAIDKQLLSVNYVNPRDFCDDAHQQIDDAPYGGGEGMVIKAEPVIRAVESIIQSIGDASYQLIMPTPSQRVFAQTDALHRSSYQHLIWVCGRYEGIDARFAQWAREIHQNNFCEVSLGSFVLLGGEVAAMTMIEAVARLVPGVIKESGSRQHESYNPLHGMRNIEHPHYTRPEEVRGMKVPPVLLSGDDAAIASWRELGAE